VKINFKDLELLTNMANTKNIDYTEIDRILNSMFKTVKTNVFQSTNSYIDIDPYYDQVKEISFFDLNFLSFILIVLLYISF